MAARTDKRITCSEIKTARTCAQKHNLLYRIGLRPDDPGKALRFGAAFHEGLDQRAQMLMYNQAPDEALTIGIAAALREFDKRAPQENDDLYSEYILQRTQLVTMLSVYHWRWTDEDKHLKVLASEQKFNVPIVNPATGHASRTYTLAGKIDKIIQLPDSRIAVMEHKTSGQDIDPVADYWKRLRIDTQISLYYMAAQQVGYTVDTVLYDVIRKPTIGLATMTQGRTKTLVEDGAYMVKGDGEEDIEVGRIDNSKLLMKDDEAQPYAVIIDGEETPVTQGAKGFAIKETLGLYAMRLNYELYTNHTRYFQRQEVPRNEADLAESQYELWREAQRMRENEKAGVFPRNDDACIGFGRCPFFDLCCNAYEPQPDVAPPAGFHFVKSVHQELEEE